MGGRIKLHGDSLEEVAVNCLTRPLSGRSTFYDDDSWAAVLFFFWSLFLILICEERESSTEPKVARADNATV